MWKTKSDAARRMIQAKFAQKRMARMKPVKTVQPAGGRTMPPASVLAKPQPAKLQLAKEAGPLAQDSPAAENCLAAKAGPAGWQEGRGLLNDGTQSAGRASLQAHVLACGNPLGLEAQLEGRLPATPGSPVPPDPLFLLGQAGQASDRVLADSMACGQNVAQDCVQACVKACTKDCFKAAGEANADAPAATALQAASAMSCALSSVRTKASASTRPRPRRRIKPRAEDGSLMALYREAAAEVLRMALAEDEASGSPSPTCQLGQPSQPDQHSRPLKPFQSGETFQASRTQHSPQALHARQAPQSPRASGRPQSVDAAGLKGKPAVEPGPDAGRLAGPYAGHRAGPDALKAGKGAVAPASAPVSGPISGPKTAQASAPKSGQASAAAGLALSARLSVHVEAAGLGQPSASNASFQASLHLASAGPEHGQAWRDALQTRYSLQVLKSLEDLGPALLVPKRVPKRAGKTLPAQGLTTAGRARSDASKPHTPRSDAPLSETPQSGSPGVKAQAQGRGQAAARHAGQAYAGPAHAGHSPAARLPAGTRKAGQSRSSERIASQVPASGHRGCRHASHDKQPGNVKQAKQAKQPMHPSQIRQANQIRQPSPCPLPRQFPGLQGLAPLPQHGKPVQPGKPGKLSKPAKPVIPSSPAAPHQPAQENRSMQQRTQLSAFQPVDQATSQPSAVLPWDRDDEELSPPQAGAMPLVSGMPPVSGMSSGQAGGCPEHPGPAAPAQGAACPPGCCPGFEHRFTGSCAGMAPQAMAQASFASQRLFDEDGDELFGCVLFDSGRSFNGWAALEDGEALRLPPQGLAALPRQGHFFSNLSWEERREAGFAGSFLLDQGWLGASLGKILSRMGIDLQEERIRACEFLAGLFARTARLARRLVQAPDFLPEASLKKGFRIRLGAERESLAREALALALGNARSYYVYCQGRVSRGKALNFSLPMPEHARHILAQPLPDAGFEDLAGRQLPGRQASPALCRQWLAETSQDGRLPLLVRALVTDMDARTFHLGGLGEACAWRGRGEKKVWFTAEELAPLLASSRVRVFGALRAESASLPQRFLDALAKLPQGAVLSPAMSLCALSLWTGAGQNAERSMILRSGKVRMNLAETFLRGRDLALCRAKAAEVEALGFEVAGYGLGTIAVSCEGHSADELFGLAQQAGLLPPCLRDLDGTRQDKGQAGRPGSGRACGKVGGNAGAFTGDFSGAFLGASGGSRLAVRPVQGASSAGAAAPGQGGFSAGPSTGSLAGSFATPQAEAENLAACQRLARLPKAAFEAQMAQAAASGAGALGFAQQLCALGAGPLLVQADRKACELVLQGDPAASTASGVMASAGPASGSAGAEGAFPQGSAA